MAHLSELQVTRLRDWNDNHPPSCWLLRSLLGSELQVTRLRDWNLGRVRFCLRWVCFVWITSYPITGLKPEGAKWEGACRCLLVWITSYPITGLKQLLGLWLCDISMAGLSELQVTRLRDWNILAGILSLGALFGLNYKLPDYGIETVRISPSYCLLRSVWITSYPITGLKQLLGLWLCDISMAGLSELQVTRLRDWNI